MLDVHVLLLLCIILGNREQLALAQGLARGYIDQDQQLLEELLYYSLVLVNSLLAPRLCPIASSIEEGVLE